MSEYQIILICKYSICRSNCEIKAIGRKPAEVGERIAGYCWVDGTPITLETISSTTQINDKEIRK